MLARRHVDVNDFHGEPAHEDAEGEHGEHAADARIIRRIVFVRETDGLAEPVELLQELVVRIFRHLRKDNNYYNL